jgi:hypothetical protein
MKAITRSVWSHLSLNDKEERHTAKEVRESGALIVDKYSDLVKHIAYISYKNADYSLFFRAQDKDYVTKEGGSTLYPSIYRDLKNNASRYITITQRFDLLKSAEGALMREFERLRFLGRAKIDKFPEVRWAILQHYEVCQTPLLDVTHSLRVACSFALHMGQKVGRKYSYVYVLGFPHINGSISYSVEEELLNVKLLSICPPRALRPHFQEGFLVGSFPSSDKSRSESLDVARRLIAKFRLNNHTFEDENFTRIPQSSLYPSNDSIERICKKIKSDLRDKPLPPLFSP